MSFGYSLMRGKRQSMEDFYHAQVGPHTAPAGVLVYPAIVLQFLMILAQAVLSKPVLNAVQEGS